MYIPRIQQDQLAKLLTPGRCIILSGIHQSGKTTLINEWYNAFPDKKQVIKLDCEDYSLRSILTEQDIPKLNTLLGAHSICVIDHAHLVPGIGETIVSLMNEQPFLRIIISTSARLDIPVPEKSILHNRLLKMHIYPIAQAELQINEPNDKSENLLENRIVYGMYPAVMQMTDNTAREDRLKALLNDMLVKEIAAREGWKKTDKILHLLRLLAWQTGREVSFPELGEALSINRLTAQRYLDLLHELNIIYPLMGYCTNPRREIAKSKRWYFTDNGILNAVQNDFRSFTMRPDAELLWHNFVISERMKVHELRRDAATCHFWKTYSGQEISLVEKSPEHLKAYNIGIRKPQSKVPSEWQNLYPDGIYKTIITANALEFI